MLALAVTGSTAYAQKGHKGGGGGGNHGNHGGGGNRGGGGDRGGGWDRGGGGQNRGQAMKQQRNIDRGGVWQNRGGRQAAPQVNWGGWQNRGQAKKQQRNENRAAWQNRSPRAAAPQISWGGWQNRGQAKKAQRQVQRNNNWNREVFRPRGNDRAQRVDRSPNWGRIQAPPAWGRDVYSKQAKREMKYERKAMQNYWKQERREERNYSRDSWRGRIRSSPSYRWQNRNVYTQNYYYDDDYDSPRYYRGSGIKHQILRSVLGSLFGGNLGNYYNGYSSQPNYGYYNSDPYYYRVPMRVYSYRTYSSGYYEPSYSSYGYDPYGYNDPYAYNGYDPYDYGYDSPLFGGLGSGGGFQQILPLIGGLIGQFTGDDGAIGELISQTVGYGYDQGYYAGQYAVDNGYSETDFYDPYQYSDVGYDPYSLSIGQNRAILSQGYEAGYRDGYQAAQNEQYDYGYDPMQDGNVDLVSVMLGNVLNTML
jgi:hypothetical protein